MTTNTNEDRVTVLDTAVVLAVDRFDQPVGSPVLSSHLDDRIDADTILRSGPAAVAAVVTWSGVACANVPMTSSS